MPFLFLAPLFLGCSLWPPSCLPFLAPIDFLADFIALPTAFRVNILTIVFTTTLPMPPIRLVLPHQGCLTWEVSQGTSDAGTFSGCVARPPPGVGRPRRPPRPRPPSCGCGSPLLSRGREPSGSRRVC